MWRKKKKREQAHICHSPVVGCESHPHSLRHRPEPAVTVTYFQLHIAFTIDSAKLMIFWTKVGQLLQKTLDCFHCKHICYSNVWIKEVFGQKLFVWHETAHDFNSKQRWFLKCTLFLICCVQVKLFGRHTWDLGRHKSVYFQLKHLLPLLLPSSFVWLYTMEAVKRIMNHS